MHLLRYCAQLLAVATFISCSNTGTQEEQKTEHIFSKEFLDQIEVTPVTFRRIEQQLKLTGKVECDPSRIVYYTPLVNGMVMSMHFNLGDQVAKGQTMVVIHSAELSALHAEKQGIEAEISILTRNMESTLSLYNDRLASRKELTEAEVRLRQAEVELKKVSQTLAIYGTPEQGGKAFQLKAPASGFVTDCKIAPGAPITSSAEPIFCIADLRKVWITANVYAGDLTFLKEGMPVDIQTMAYPDEVFHGKIDIIPQVLDPEEHVLKARIFMPNEELKLKPEMAVDLTLRKSREVSMATVPSTALIFENDRYFVIKQENDTYTVAEVKLHSQSQDISYIEGGIQPGEKVVTKNQLLMYHQLKG